MWVQTLVLRRYWTNACQSCSIKQRCTTGKYRRITRWEHKHVLEAVQRRLDKNTHAMRQRRETAEHPLGTRFPQRKLTGAPMRGLLASCRRFADDAILG
jgi:hypothetical protein